GYADDDHERDATDDERAGAAYLGTRPRGGDGHRERAAHQRDGDRARPVGVGGQHLEHDRDEDDREHHAVAEPRWTVRDRGAARGRSYGRHSVTTRSTRSRPSVRWVISSTVRSPAAVNTSSTSSLAVRGSRWAVGSSSTSTGAPAG